MRISDWSSDVCSSDLQASYVDTLLDSDPRWGIAAVSRGSAGTVDALARQDGLYSITTLGRETGIRAIAAHSAFVRPGEDARVHRLLADPAVRLLTSTVTEKGYCLAPDGTLDLSHPDIVHDLADRAAPVSIEIGRASCRERVCQYV